MSGAASEAIALGFGGITAVSLATGLCGHTIRKGIRELHCSCPLPSGRQRKSGGGRKPLEHDRPGLLKALDRLVEPTERGDPQSPLRWTCKSLANLESELRGQGFDVGRTRIRKILRSLDYSLQGNRKKREGSDHPDRNAQFEHIARRVRSCQRDRRPAISVDTKKKEILGNKANVGREYRPKGQPLCVDTHDFPDELLGKAIPYGVYDIHQNNAWVSVGTSHDTAEFAVEAVRRWWKKLGKQRYRTSKRLLITADSGGSNSSRSRLWKCELQKLADEIGLIIEVCHYPPGTSKWNKIEHRLFCHITRNWRGTPLQSHQVVVNLVSATRTSQGLEVDCRLDATKYKKGRQISDVEISELNIRHNAFHGEWNYELHPRK